MIKLPVLVFIVSKVNVTPANSEGNLYFTDVKCVLLSNQPLQYCFKLDKDIVDRCLCKRLSRNNTTLWKWKEMGFWDKSTRISHHDRKSKSEIILIININNTKQNNNNGSYNLPFNFEIIYVYYLT